MNLIDSQWLLMLDTVFAGRESRLGTTDTAPAPQGSRDFLCQMLGRGSGHASQQFNQCTYGVQPS